MSVVGLAMEDDENEKKDEDSSQYEEGCICDMCQGNGWIYDEEAVPCPECEE